MLRNSRKRSKSPFIIFVLLIIVICVFIFTSYDSKGPSIILAKDVVYSNLSQPIYVDIKDDKSISKVSVVLNQGKKSEVLIDKKLANTTTLALKIDLPKKLFEGGSDTFYLTIKADDSSWRNLFLGNSAKAVIKIIIDKQAPYVDIISNSYRIEQGGAAAVVFKAADKNLSELYIQTKAGRIFKVSPYLKKGYYAALIAWDIKQPVFRAYVIAKDKAGNTTKRYIPYFLREKKYRISHIKLKDRFLNGKIQELANIYAPKNNNFNSLEKFRFINEDLRGQNEALIYKLTSSVSTPAGKNFIIYPFHPLKHAAQVAGYGDHRYFTYDNIEISQSYHMGLDLASTGEAPIYASNAGTVVFASQNGIYGLNIIIDHGFGLYSIYGHCSSSRVKSGDKVRAGEIIAHTGKSGLALGDHVHFGILIGSVEVRPQLFEDKQWINTFIMKVLDSAKKIILSE